MSKAHPAAGVEVDDPAVAFQKLEEFAKRVLKVPKKEVDAKLLKDKSRRAKRR
jgi:hypothetical protein